MILNIKIYFFLGLFFATSVIFEIDFCVNEPFGFKGIYSDILHSTVLKNIE